MRNVFEFGKLIWIFFFFYVFNRQLFELRAVTVLQENKKIGVIL